MASQQAGLPCACAICCFVKGSEASCSAKSLRAHLGFVRVVQLLGPCIITIGFVRFLSGLKQRYQAEEQIVLEEL